MRGFTPRMIPDLQLWLDATQLNRADDDPVGVWTNLAYTNFDGSASGAARPTFKANIRQGRPVVRFDGIDDLLQLNGAGRDVVKNASGVTLFAVYADSQATTSTSLLYWSTGTNSGNARIQLSPRNTGELSIGGRRLDADAAAGSQGGTRATDEWLVHSCTGDWANVVATVWKNGVQVSQNTSWLTAGSTSNTSSAGAGVGANTGGAGYFKGDLGEAIAYQRVLTTAERMRVERYLGSKWGVAVP